MCWSPLSIHYISTFTKMEWYGLPVKRKFFKVREENYFKLLVSKPLSLIFKDIQRAQTRRIIGIDLFI